MEPKTDQIYFDGDYASWNEASKQCANPDTGQVLEKVLAGTLKIQRREPLNEKDAFFGRPQYNLGLMCSLLSAAIHSDKRLNVLDFGGSLGISYFNSSEFLQDVSALSWSVVEVPKLVEAGRKHLQSDELRFYETVEECLRDNAPNIIVLSGVLQYLPDPWETLNNLLQIGAPYMFIDRTGTIDSDRDRLTVQHVPEWIYRYDQPAWFLSETKLLSAIAFANYTCLLDFVSGYGYELPGAKILLKGFLCRATSSVPKAQGDCTI
jgi:putative methyltransferase (TIGR04325 family)